MSGELIRFSFETFGEANLARETYLVTSPDDKVEIYRSEAVNDTGETFELVIHPQEGLTEQIVKGRLLDQLYGRSLDD